MDNKDAASSRTSGGTTKERSKNKKEEQGGDDTRSSRRHSSSRRDREDREAKRNKSSSRHHDESGRSEGISSSRRSSGRSEGISSSRRSEKDGESSRRNKEEDRESRTKRREREDREAKRRSRSSNSAVPGAQASTGDHKSNRKSSGSHRSSGNDRTGSRKSDEKAAYRSRSGSASVPGAQAETRTSSSSRKSDEKASYRSRSGSASVPGAQAESSSSRSRSKRDEKGKERRSTRATKPGAESATSSQDKSKAKSRWVDEGDINVAANDNNNEGVSQSGEEPVAIAAMIVEDDEQEDAIKQREKAAEQERQRLQAEHQRMQEEMERREAERKEQEVKEKKKRRNIILCAVLVIVLMIGGGVAAFIALQKGDSGSSNVTETNTDPDEETAGPSADPSESPSLNPTEDLSSAPTNAQLKYEQPSLEECENIAAGLPITGEDEMFDRSFDVLMEVDLVDDGTDIDTLVQELETQIKKLLVPDLIGCPRDVFATQQRRGLGHHQTANEANASTSAHHRQMQSVTIIRYAIIKTVVKVTVTNNACKESSSNNCSVVAANLGVKVRGDERNLLLMSVIALVFPSGQDILPDLELIAPFAKVVIGIISSLDPTTAPSMAPTGIASEKPSGVPSRIPSTSPTSAPVSGPTTPAPVDTPAPVTGPTAPAPTKSPSKAPSKAPTPPPTLSPPPTVAPQPGLTPSPTTPPTPLPTKNPTVSPSKFPSSSPSFIPSWKPSLTSSLQPSVTPSIASSLRPSVAPTRASSESPSRSPTSAPSFYCPAACEDHCELGCKSGYCNDQSNYYLLKAPNGKCWDYSIMYYNKLIRWDCNYGDNQYIQLTAAGQITNRLAPNLCLSGVSGEPVFVTCDATSAKQLFNINDRGQVSLQQEPQWCLGFTPVFDQGYATEFVTWVPCSSQDSVLPEAATLSQGGVCRVCNYDILKAPSGKCWDYSPMYYNKLIRWDCNFGDNQYIQLTAAGQITNRLAPNLCLSGVSGEPVFVTCDATSAKQLFNINDRGQVSLQQEPQWCLGFTPVFDQGYATEFVTWVPCSSQDSILPEAATLYVGFTTLKNQNDKHWDLQPWGFQSMNNIALVKCAQFASQLFLRNAAGQITTRSDPTKCLSGALGAPVFVDCDDTSAKQLFNINNEGKVSFKEEPDWCLGFSFSQEHATEVATWVLCSSQDSILPEAKNLL